MSKRVEALTEKRVLRPFASLLYLAWADGDLQDAECAHLSDLLLKSGLPDDDAQVINLWLDEKNPPSANELAALHAHQDASWKSLESKVHAEGFKVLFDNLHLKASTCDDEFNVCLFDLDALVDFLHGSEIEVRKKVLARLCEAPFERVLGDSKAVARERVLEWTRVLADEGYGALPYQSHERAAAEFIAAFESCSHFDLNLVVKMGVQFGLFGGSIFNLGTKEQHAILEEVASLDMPGAFAMTERGHGSNVRDLETTARYDKQNDCFIVHTPNDAAHKEYIGNAACHAKMATVFAQLIIGDENHGVHALLVPLRDDVGQTLEGIRIEDCGEKMGLNGVDNGRIWFDNVRVQRSALLARFGSVDAEGQYSSPIASPSRRFFTMLGTLVAGRVSVACAALAAAKSGLAVAVRYGAMRKQFGEDNADEMPILSYPSHKARLMPRVAKAYALHFATRQIVEEFVQRSEETQRDLEGRAAIVKVMATDFCTDALQTARQCCGGQGYLAGNLLSSLKADSDVFTTFEGDNTVLKLLVAKGLLTEFKNQFSDDKMWSTLRFLARTASDEVNLANPFTSRDDDPKHLRDAQFHEEILRYRERVLVRQVGARLSGRIKKGVPMLDAFLECQNHLLVLADAHGERIAHQIARDAIRNAPQDSKETLDRLLDLYALTQVQKSSAWFFERGVLSPAKSKALRREIENLSDELSRCALPLVDAFGIPMALLPPIAHDDTTVRLR